MATRTLEIVLAGDSTSALREFKRVDDGARRLGDRFDREGKRVHGFATISSRGFARVGAASSAMQAVAGGAAVLLAKKFITSASDINESLTKNQVLFGKFADDVVSFSDRSAKSFGISKAAALEYTGVFGNLFRALDVSREKSAGMSVQLTKLAADMASFNNTSIDDALEAIRSGLVGETEPLRRFGVNMNDAQLRVQALKLGLTDTTKNVLTPYQRSMAAVSLITKQTAAAHGDFQRTSGGLANQTRILQARLQDTAASIGAKLLPFALRATTALNDLITETQAGRGPLAALAANVSNLARKISDVVGWFHRHRDATTVLIAVVASLTTGFVVYRTTLLATAIATRSMTVATAALNVVMRLNPIGLVVTAVAALSAALVVAYKRSDTFRRIVDTAFTGVKKSVQSAVNVFNTVLLPAFRTIVSAGQKVANVIGKIGGVLGSVGNAAGDVAGFLKIGDGIGQLGSSLSAPGGAVNLKGADPDLLPFASLGARMGLQVSSGLRVGSITSSGNVSYHSSGDAIDEYGPMSSMHRFAQTLYSRFGGRLRELISPWPELGIKDGHPFRYSSQIQAEHSGGNAHVHVAYTGPFGDGIGQAVDAAYKAGFRGDDLVRIVAIAGRESGYDNQAKNFVYPDHSIGMTQINQLAHKGRYGTDKQLMDPYVNFRAAWAISGHGRNFSPWSTNRGLSQANLDRARRAVRSYMASGGKKKSPKKPGQSTQSWDGSFTPWEPPPNGAAIDSAGGFDTGGGSSSDGDVAAAIAENTAAVTALRASIDAQMAFAQSVQATESNVIKKSLADVLSGTLGPMIASRRLTPGSGVERAW